MRWFRRTRRRASRPAMRKFNESELPSLREFSLAEAVSEGLMLAEHSSRLRVKNRVIVGVLTTDRSFDASDYLDEARAAIAVLVGEFDLEGMRIDKQLRVARSVPGNASHAHDYRSGDARNLKHRADVLAVVSETLRERQADNKYLLDLIENARNDAWGEISRAVENWLDRSNIVVDVNYERDRSKRLRKVTEDLSTLQASHAS